MMKTAIQVRHGNKLKKQKIKGKQKDFYRGEKP